jgi:uncharacterized Rmd1/YagE family protein
MQAASGTIKARAHCVGMRIDTRELEKRELLAPRPLVLPAGRRGRAVVFRFGAYVGFDLDAEETATLARLIEPWVTAAFPAPESESAEIVEAPEQTEGIDANGRIVVSHLDAGRLQVIASVLAKSTALAHFEEEVAKAFETVDALAERLRRGDPPARGRELSRQIGEVLLTQSRMVGRVEVAEKPEITWDDPALDRLYERMAVEYELVERDRALSRKLDLIALTAGTVLDLVNQRQGLRVEWYIVILILIEIAIIVYDIAVRAG